MKKVKFTLIVSLLFLSVISKKGFSQNDNLVIKGAYLGQKPPGLNAEVFAPDIVSNIEAMIEPSAKPYVSTEIDQKTN